MFDVASVKGVAQEMKSCSGKVNLSAAMNQE